MNYPAPILNTLTVESTAFINKALNVGGTTLPSDAAVPMLSVTELTINTNWPLNWNQYQPTAGARKYIYTDYSAQVWLESASGNMYFELYPLGTAGTVLGTPQVIIYNQGGSLQVSGLTIPVAAVPSVGSNSFILPPGAQLTWNLYRNSADGTMRYLGTNFGAQFLSNGSGGVNLNMYPSGTPGASALLASQFTFYQNGSMSFNGGLTPPTDALTSLITPAWATLPVGQSYAWNLYNSTSGKKYITAGFAAEITQGTGAGNVNLNLYATGTAGAVVAASVAGLTIGTTGLLISPGGLTVPTDTTSAALASPNVVVNPTGNIYWNEYVNASSAIRIVAGYSAQLGYTAVGNMFLNLWPTGAAGGALTGTPAGQFTFAQNGAFTASGGITGFTTGTNAASGIVGEFITTTGGPGAITASAWTSVASIPLPPGDWDVWGYVAVSAAAFVISNVNAGIGTTSNAAVSPFASINVSPANIANYNVALPMVRYNITATTTVYGNVFVALTSGSPTATVILNARRRR
jgi:hypothetical protein